MDSRDRRRLLAAAAALLLLLLLGGAAKFLVADGAPATTAPSPGAGGRGSPRGRDGSLQGESAAAGVTAPPGGALIDPPKKTEPVKAPEAPDSAPRAVELVAPAPTPVAKPGKYSGRVVEGGTGQPVAGARVLLGMSDPTGGRGWYGDRTGPDGAFRFDVLETMSRDSGRKVEEDELSQVTFDLRVLAAGYETARIRSPEHDREIRLVRDPTPPLPGTVRGVVTKQEDGSAFHGRIKLETTESEWEWYACPYAWTDERGNYVLEGVPAGQWKMRISSWGSFETVVVPEGGEAFLNLKVHGSIDEGSDALPAENREVVVAGFTADALKKYWMRAETRPGHFFRVAVVGGRARFPALPLRRYRFVLERPGEEEIAVEVDVVAGEGAQGVDFDTK